MEFNKFGFVVEAWYLMWPDGTFVAKGSTSGRPFRAQHISQVYFASRYSHAERYRDRHLPQHLTIHKFVGFKPEGGVE